MVLNNFILVVFFVTVTKVVEGEKGLFRLRFKKTCIPSKWCSVVASSIMSGVRKQINAVLAVSCLRLIESGRSLGDDNAHIRLAPLSVSLETNLTHASGNNLLGDSKSQF